MATTVTRRLQNTTDAICSTCPPGVMVLWAARNEHIAWHDAHPDAFTDSFSDGF